MTTKEKISVAVVPPFGIEVDHPRNCDIMLQSIPDCRLRSAVSPVVTNVDGTVRTMTAKGLTPPVTPGMQLHVNPEKCSYVVSDPMFGNDEACEKVDKFLTAIGELSGVNNKIRGVPTLQGTLDVHRMKTLCRELVGLLETGDIKMIKGPKPDLEEVNELPGNYLLNPGSRVHNSQPRYEKDLPAWEAQLSRAGG